MSLPSTPTFVPRLETLPLAQRALWPDLAGLSALGYVLYGGTAIALRLGHRASVDFDFFTDRPLDKVALRTAFPFIARSIVLQDTPDSFTVLIPPVTLAAPDHPDPNAAGGAQPVQSDEVKISFFGGIGFGRVGVPELTTDGVAQVASRDDLMATKLKVLLQRVEAKDYSDIVALLTHGAPLDRGLAAARLLFGPAFQPSECLKALVYFQGGDLDTLSLGSQRTLIDAAAAVGPLPQIALMAHTLALTADLR
jgi:nucleotidyltransferase AbiEii toxin of type IV toxin-antitoxin system